MLEYREGHTVPHTQREMKHMATEPKLCRSGSGKTALKGTFAPGGDASYKRDLIGVVINGPVPKDQQDAIRAELLEKGYDEDFISTHAWQFMTAKRAAAVLEDRGWTKFLDRKRETVDAAAAKKIRAAENKEAKRIEAERVKAEKAATKAAAEEAQAENAA